MRSLGSSSVRSVRSKASTSAGGNWMRITAVSSVDPVGTSFREISQKRADCESERNPSGDDRPSLAHSRHLDDDLARQRARAADGVLFQELLGLGGLIEREFL